jgi:penicillin-binding protein 2
MNQYSIRQYIIGAIMLLVLFVYIVRLFYIQLIDNSYKISADNNSQRYVTQYPARGIIYDRNHKVLVCNEAAYDLMVSPMELKSFDTIEFCNILNITPLQVRETIKKARNYSRYKSSPFLYQISDTTYAILQEKLYKYPGFYVQPRTLRKYNTRMASHLFGYVGECDSSHIKKDGYYQIGDYVGMSGIEKKYEKELRGKKGVNIYIVDVHNRIKGSFRGGRYDTTAIVGNDIVSTIDADLQQYGEKLMSRFRGSIVAIEPATGEILAFVSSPAYDPSLLVGRVRSKNYRGLAMNPEKPLFNRAVMAVYPPGSTFKLVNALIGLKENVVESETRFGCQQGFHMGSITLGCHVHGGPLNMTQAIQTSCNAYFCNVHKRIIENPGFNTIQDAYTTWRNYAMTFGFGNKLGVDIPTELSGNMPSAKYFNKIYGEKGWRWVTIRSLSIGQGEIGITPLQMANMTATMANRGYYIVPHVVKGIGEEPNNDTSYHLKHYTPFDTSLYSIVVKGMQMAVNGPDGGTARVAQLPDVVICGKTGTAQNPHGEDHSIFLAFAPKENPKIAITVYVENGGFGATYAAPIASLMIEKYLNDTISRPWMEERLLNTVIDYNKKAVLKYKLKKHTD